MLTKNSYETPTMEILMVELRAGIMGLSNGVNYSDTAGGAGGDDTYDDGGSF